MATKLSPFLIRPCGAPSPRGKVFPQTLSLSNNNLSFFNPFKMPRRGGRGILEGGYITKPKITYITKLTTAMPTQ